MSIRIKLLLSALTVTLLMWVVAAYVTYRDTKRDVSQLFDGHLLESAVALLKQAQHERREIMMQENSEDPDGKDDAGESDDDVPIAGTSREIEELREHEALFEKRLFFEIWNNEGELLLRTHDHLKDIPTEDEGFYDVRKSAIPMRVYSQWNQDHTLRIVVAESLDARDALSRRSLRGVLKTMAISSFVLLMLLVFVIEWSLKPIRNLSAEIANRSANDLSDISYAKVPKELLSTVKSLNLLFRKLTHSIEKERRFTADAAHELRTPLAAIRIQAEVALREVDSTARAKALKGTIEGVDRATHLVEQLLLLARLDPDESVPLDKLSLKELVISAIQDVAPIAIAKSIEIVLEESADCLVSTHEPLVKILLRNLIDNAVRYTPEHGFVKVSLNKNIQGDCIVIEDSGSGLTAEQLKIVGQLFNRLNRPSGGGSGLGLSIVMKIAAILNLTVSFENLTNSSGLKVCVQFSKVTS
ncbi:MAG: sensor histidine kinase N-terminal domain-containing protein [Proteobacteria bacterium]|nr:sensor histidine kinase N-terminal domain-containing protein [Pseudomonadota bacterium]